MAIYVKVSREKLEHFLQACGFTRRVHGREVVYVRANHMCPDVLIKVWTTLPADGGDIRGKGQDAIRISAAYESDLPLRGRKDFGIYKGTRVFRVGTEQNILDRLYERMREAYGFSNEWVRENWEALKTRPGSSSPATPSPAKTGIST